MMITYEGCDVYTLHIGFRKIQLSLSEIEEIQRFDGIKSTFELDGYIEDLEMDIDDLNNMLTRDRKEIEDKDEEISELQNKLYNLEQNLINSGFNRDYIDEMENKVLDKRLEVVFRVILNGVEAL